MGRYLIKRLGGLLFVIVALVIFTFFATNVLGDPIALLTDPETTSPEDIARLRAANGLDRPLLERFLDHTTGAFQGDFGKSIALGRPAGEIVLERVPATMGLAIITVIFSVIVAIILSITSVRLREKAIANVINVVSTALACLPSFWLAILLIIGFAVNWNVFPTSGYGWGLHLILPVLSLSAQPIGYFTQILTTGMMNEFDQNYVRAARSKGLTEFELLREHVLRNTAILGVTMLGSMIASLINGAVLAENIFAWPGIGNLGLSAVQNRDLPVLTAVIFYAGLTVTVINLALDIIYTRVDPRVRLG